MNTYFKNFTFLILVFLCSCQDDCTDGTLSQDILGTWNISNPVSTTNDDTVSFSSDFSGTGTENGSFYSENGISNSTTFTWFLDESTNDLTLTYSNNSEIVLKVLNHNCKSILIDATIANWMLSK